MERLDHFEGEKVHLILTSSSPSQTEHIGKAVGEAVPAGTVISLKGGLGAGKTVFVKGLSHGLGVHGQVLSPTFILLEEYRGVLPLYHFDLYRLNGVEEAEEIGIVDAIDGTNVVVVEWGDRLPPEWLGEDIVVSIKILEEKKRRIDFEAPSDLIDILRRERVS